jgi:hypothetical protein
MITEPDLRMPLLPVLPEPAESTPLPVLSAKDARLAALLGEAPEQRLQQAVFAVVDRLLTTLNGADGSVLAAIGRSRTVPANASAEGTALRRLIADTTKPPVVRAVARTFAVVFSAPPADAITAMVAARLPLSVGDVVLEELADIPVTSVLPEPPAQTLPLAPGMLPARGRRAAPFGQVLPSAGTFLEGPDDQETSTK